MPPELKRRFTSENSMHELTHLETRIPVDILSHVFKSDYTINRELLEYMMTNPYLVSNQQKLDIESDIMINVAKPEFIVGSKCRALVSDTLTATRKRIYAADVQQIMSWMHDNNTLNDFDAVRPYLWESENEYLDNIINELKPEKS